MASPIYEKDGTDTGFLAFKNRPGLKNGRIIRTTDIKMKVAPEPEEFLKTKLAERARKEEDAKANAGQRRKISM